MFPQRLEERRAWLRRGFARAVECALDQEAHLFLQVGDLFDTPEPRNAERQFVAEALARLRAAGIPCLGIGGNHDTPRSRGGFLPATPQGTYARLGGLRLLGDERAASEQASKRASEEPGARSEDVAGSGGILPASSGRAGGSWRAARERLGPGASPAAGHDDVDEAGQSAPPYENASPEGASQDSGLRTQDSSLHPSPFTLHPSQSSVPSPQSLVDYEVFNIDGVRVAVGGMAPDPTLRAGADPLEGVEWHPNADVSILLVHGSLQGHVYPGAPEPVIQRKSVERLGVDCLLVGHVHKYATFEWGKTLVVVPGATERMTFGEVDSRPGFVYLELTPGQSPEVTHASVDPQPRRQVDIPSPDLDGEDPAELLKLRLEEVCDREAMVRVCLEGPITRQRYHDLRLREAAEFGAARCFFLDLDTTGLFVEDDLPREVARTGRLSPKEELIRYGEEVRESVSPEERDLIDEAMHAILSEYE